MTDAQFKERMFQLYDQWGQGSNESDDQEKIAEAGELFIASFLDAITLADGQLLQERPYRVPDPRGVLGGPSAIPQTL